MIVAMSSWWAHFGCIFLLLLAPSVYFQERFNAEIRRKGTPAIRKKEASEIRQYAQTNFSGIEARAFEPWSNDALPCYEPQAKWRTPQVQRNRTGAEIGFNYMKPMKTGSSTTSGINIRIARNVARRLDKSYGFCRARFDHGPTGFPAADLGFAQRDPARSFLWSVLRDPTKRAVSHFFHFEVSRNKTEPSDANFLKYMFNGTHRFFFRDYYYKTLYTKSHFNRVNHNPIRVGNDILSEYNFLGITERMDESAVVLMMLLKLKLSDVLYLSAKSSGGFEAFKCKYVWPSFVTPGMQQYFDSDDWQDRIQYDIALYQSVNASLDLTIDRLGREVFATNLARFQRARVEAQKRCLPIVKFPCDFASGRRNIKHDCIWNDSGCGMACLDEIATEMGLD